MALLAKEQGRKGMASGEETLALTQRNSEFSDGDAKQGLSVLRTNFTAFNWKERIYIPIAATFGDCANKLKKFIDAAINHWKWLGPIPFAMNVELFLALVIVILEAMMQIIKNFIATAPANPIPIRRMGQHQHQVNPTQGLFFLVCLNFVLAGGNSYTLWAYGNNHFAPRQLFVHWTYAILGVYCAVVEFFDITLGQSAQKYFPFGIFPFLISVGILSLLILEVAWKLFTAQGPIHIIAPAPPENHLAPSTFAAAPATSTLRLRGRSKGSSSISSCSSSTDASSETIAKAKNEPKSVRGLISRFEGC